MKPPISLVLATAENCQLGCKGCPTGRSNLRWGNEKPGNAKAMTVSMAERIIQKAKREAHVLSVCLYYFNEPFLLPNLLELVQLFKREKLYNFYSTNLSFNPENEAFKSKLHAFMDAEPSNVIVSISGWSQETYSRYHANGNIEWVKANLLEMARLRKPGTFLRLSWHIFHYNQHEREQAEQFAREHGFCFTPYGVGVLPLERTLARWEDGQTDPAEEDILVPLQTAKALSYPRRFWNCQMQQQTMTVDANGTVYNCSDRYGEHNNRGSFFDRCVSDILKARKKDTDCVSCKKVGGHIYGAQEYTVPILSPTRWADMLYRWTGLQGFYQRNFFNHWKRAVESHYDRPQEVNA